MPILSYAKQSQNPGKEAALTRTLNSSHLLYICLFWSGFYFCLFVCLLDFFKERKLHKLWVMPNTFKKSILGNDTNTTCETLCLYCLCPHGNAPCLWSLQLVGVGRARPLWVAQSLGKESQTM